MSVIKDLYQGDIHPEESCQPDTEEYREAVEKAFESYSAFYESLSPEQQALYDAHEAARITAEGMEQEERFRQGFRIGAMLMRELLDRK